MEGDEVFIHLRMLEVTITFKLMDNIQQLFQLELLNQCAQLRTWVGIC